METEHVETVQSPRQRVPTGRDVLDQAHGLAMRVYNSTRSFPIAESKGLVYETRQSILAVSAFLSDALRKEDQHYYLLSVIEAIERHLGDLRRALVVSRFLMYLQPDDFEDLDRRAETVKQLLLDWKRSIEDLRLPSVGADPER